ncbi:uncharacterized protein LOC143628669 [Bidens hawaiensis]|uniref:uncharacterized protein LOC143628669 n=1 Tax=Bidens hawaiensis TaxID=980011 RepID=UPI00404AE09D
MSQNHMKGTLTLFIPPTLDLLDLSANDFTGKLPYFSNGSLMPVHLDLSNNSFVESLQHFLCFNGVEKTEYLSLGHNYLSGVIPECWEKWSSLRILNLENNNLSGEIPMTLGSLSNLYWLNMHGNEILGRLPSSLMNLSMFNNLDGNIPDELCYLSNAQVLDLAYNKLSGNIPRCFNNFSVLSGITNPIGQDGIGLEEIASYITFSDTLVMKGQEQTYIFILAVVTLLDLSSNNITGHIPSELSNLQELISLNLSRNQLTGKIPEKIGDMKALESLDLSVNKLSGELPTSLSKLNFLSSLNVSYNNLTGRIPVSTQLQSFNESSYLSNKLCGAPLSDQCAPVEILVDTIGDHKEDDGSEWGLIISTVLGFITGFWIIDSQHIMEDYIFSFYE